jgi:sugar lactone lactonase YvrE
MRISNFVGTPVARVLTQMATVAVMAVTSLLFATRARADQATPLVPGSNVLIEVTATGTPPFTYQWRKNGVNISGATQSFLFLPSVSSSAIGSYSVVVTNSAGSTISDRAFINAEVVYAPTITTQPASQTVIIGDTASFSVAAAGSQPITYQWRKDGVDIPGAIEPDLIIDEITTADFGVYTVVASNAGGSEVSLDAVVTDATVAPQFLSQLESQVLAPGDNTSFTLVAEGTQTITYQWQKNGVSLVNGGVYSGVTTSTLTLTGLTGANSGTYTLIATNAAGSVTSNEATLNVVAPPPPGQTLAPFFVVSPTPKTVATATTVSFVAEVTAAPEATYQWQKNGVDLIGVGKYAGTTTPILTIYNVDGSFGGTYQLVATNSVGTATSVGALLTVLVNQAPIFTTQPVSQSVMTGQVAFFSFVVSAYPKATYQWKKNGVNLTNSGNIQGATSTTLSVSNVSSSDLGIYSVVATNVVGTTTSDEVTLSIDGSPAITSQPSALTVVNSGAVVNLAVTVGGDPAPTLQWRRNGVNLVNGGAISGATTSTLTLSNVTNANSGKYTVVATNSRGSITSSEYEVAVLGSNVSSQPATTGKDITLAAPEASGNVQWQISNDFGANWTNLSNSGAYSGVTTNTLNIAGVTSSLNNSLFRLVTSGTTTVLHSARLTVIEAFLPFPVAVSSDASGNVYVADASSDTIGKINPSIQISVHAGTSGQTGTADGAGTAARFNDPSGIVSSPDGTLAVADKANATLRVVSPTGVVTTLAGSTTLRGNIDGTGSSATFSSPLGVARDTAGNYYVADSMNHTVRKITAAGVVTTLAGAAGQAGSADGTGATARFNNPSGIDVDLGGNLYVADTTNNTIRKITPSGVVTTLAGLAGVSGNTDGTGAIALFNQPTGIAVDSAANIYVADTANSTVRRITPAGVVSTLAGLPGIAGHKDGSGLGAWFNQPRDVSVSSGGFLYVADTGNASIRRVELNGSVSTLALTTAAGPSQPLPLPETPTLPSTPTLPTVPTTPTLPTSPTPPSAPSSGGGGGGAPSLWFLGALSAVWLFRRLKWSQR